MRGTVLVIHACCLLLVCSCGRLPRRAALSVNATGTTAETTRVNINRASAEELEQLPGIGKGLAARIVEHREKYGPFRKPEHLLMVRGISDRKFRELRPLISVD
jgi:competence protein ComEA